MSSNRLGELLVRNEIINEDQLKRASEEQKRGIDQINTAVGELDTMTQQNASLVEETASASEEMSNQAQEMLLLVTKFRIAQDFSEKRVGSGVLRHSIEGPVFENVSED